MTNAKATNRWLWTARVITALSGLTLLAVFFAARRDGETGEIYAWAATPYLLLFTLLCVRPMIKIALGIILMAAPTALFLCIFPLGIAGLAWSEGAEWVGLLVIAALITASQAALLGVAAKWFEHKYGTKNANTLVVIGCAICGVLLGIVLWLKYLEKI
jgi:hypothetical protein